VCGPLSDAALACCAAGARGPWNAVGFARATAGTPPRATAARDDPDHHHLHCSLQAAVAAHVCIPYPGGARARQVGYKFRFFGADAEAAAAACNIFAYYDDKMGAMSASVPVPRLHVYVRRLVEAGHKARARRREVWGRGSAPGRLPGRVRMLRRTRAETQPPAPAGSRSTFGGRACLWRPLRRTDTVRAPAGLGAAVVRSECQHSAA